MDLFRRMRRAPQGAAVNFPIPPARTATNNAMNPESVSPAGANPNRERQSQIGSATTSGHDTPAEAAPAIHSPLLLLAKTADILLRTGLDPDILHAALTIQRERDGQGVVDAPNPAPSQPSTPQAPEPVFPVRPPARDPYREQQQQQYHRQYYQPQQYYHQPQQYYQPPQYHHHQPQYYHQPQQPQASPNGVHFRFYNPETRRTERQPVSALTPAPAPVIVDLTSPERPTAERNHDEADLE